MDPLSITTSIIAIVSLAGKVCSAFATLRSICQNLPGRLHAVNNEVADLELVLLQVALLTKERTILPNNHRSAIPHFSLLKYQRSKLKVSAANFWRKEQGSLQTSQDAIRTIKCNLIILLGASNSQDMMQIRLNIEAISAATYKSSEEQSIMQDRFTSSLAAVDDRVARVEELLRAQTEQLHQNQSTQIGPMHNVVVARRRHSAQCVNFALNGDVEGLKYLFRSGLASPRDVSSTRGCSLIRWALHGKQYETCEFLLYAGADPDYRPIAATDNNPRNKAFHFLLEGGLPDDGVSALTTITRGGHFEDFIDESKFTQTHRIVLGLSLLDLEEEIKLHPEGLDTPDSMGRTPLAWAAARGDRRAVVTLLSHGADPNITDVQASGPVSNAATRGHTKGSPLNCAARNATDVLLLKSLLDFGADVDSSGVDGQTSLIHAARNNNASFAMLLLDHNVLRLILDRWHEYTICPRLQGPHLLQIVALYADAKTINTLAKIDHIRLKHDNQFAIGDFGNRLRQRPDMTDKLAEAFDDLLGIINAAPDPRGGVERLMESGHQKPSSPHGDHGVNGIQRIFSWSLSRHNTDAEVVCESVNIAESDRESVESFDSAESGMAIYQTPCSTVFQYLTGSGSWAPMEMTHPYYREPNNDGLLFTHLCRFLRSAPWMFTFKVNWRLTTIIIT
ncbi:hypothetical protein AJ80_09508 [Polytolypa hystricis UAMH7299]|uniref:Uncharacterized protein n=1 Tax=Polytolypa hystricis (strain UAMH7299) TaxID=1447883 RepID=A0A2B7WPW6_POLH7|nr:hypothetical protein AJ80_09508 [Polytolypa hystricis UAMH7299]